MPLPRLGDNGPERAFALLAVSPAGDVAFTTGFTEDERQVTVVDVRGGVKARVIQAGDGPGELRNILRLFLTDEAVFAFSGMARMASFTLDGEHRWTRQLAPTALPMAVRGDSLDVAAGAPDITQGYDIRRIALRTQEGRVLVSSSDTAFRGIARSAADSTRSSVVAFVAQPRGFTLANGTRYRLLAYDDHGRLRHAFGRDLPGKSLVGEELEREVERRLAQAKRPFRGPDGQRLAIRIDEARIRTQAAAARPHFGTLNGGAHADHLGRVFTVMPLGDSTALDFFGDGAFLGRVHVPCAGDAVTSAGNGAFLALLCVPPDGTVAEVGLQLYQIR
jgi:hypothetical protein